jgi:hypothetical protein
LQARIQKGTGGAQQVMLGGDELAVERQQRLHLRLVVEGPAFHVDAVLVVTSAFSNISYSARR